MNYLFACCLVVYGPQTRKPVFGGFDRKRFKLAYLSAETGKKIEFLLVASLDMILSNKPITMALIRLRGYASWSAPLLFANPR